MRIRRNGFSLIELLVAMGLGIIVVSVAAYAFHNASKGSARAIAVVEANTQIQAVINLLRADLFAMHPCAASSGFTSGTTTTDITFLTSLPRMDTNYDGSITSGTSGDTNPNHDLCWVRWEIESSSVGTTPCATIRRGIIPANGSNLPNNSNPSEISITTDTVSSPSTKGGFTTFTITLSSTTHTPRSLNGSSGTAPTYLTISGAYSTAPGSDDAIVVPFKQVIKLPY